MSKLDLRGWLRRFGHHRPLGLRGVHVPRASGSQLKGMIESAQKSLGVTIDGVAGPKTLAAMNRPRCGCPDHLRLNSARMPEFGTECQLKIGVYADFSGLRGTPTKINPGKAKELWFQSLQEYTKFVNVKFQWVGRIEDALIQAHAGRADDGVLAWMEVFDGCGGQHASRYNDRVEWTEDLFYGTAVHENGHGLGVGHSPGSVSSIMAPYHDPAIPAVVDQWLLDQLEPRYGLVGTEPDVPTVPPTEPRPGVSGMDWAAIVALILPLIIDCKENGASEGTVASALRSPNYRQMRRLRRGINRKVKTEEPGLNRLERRGRVDGLLDSIIARGREASDSEIQEVIQQAK